MTDSESQTFRFPVLVQVCCWAAAILVGGGTGAIAPRTASLVVGYIPALANGAVAWACVALGVALFGVSAFLFARTMRTRNSAAR